MNVNTKYGAIRGILSEGCYIFKGIPYAQPPVGELRFKKPQKPESWTGVYNADHYRSRSMQGPIREGFYKKEFYDNPDFLEERSEDSLYLNIWRPQNKEKNLPVAIYVHGGAFMGGAGSNLPFVCTELALSGVIVVTINYRLGAFGFLCHPLLGVAGENEAGGNYGLWDQLAAFSWVKENIESFGGDSENITVFGQSAGAMSLQTLALVSQSEGVFQKMILQSGGGYNNPLAEYRTVEKASTFAEDLFEIIGIDSKKCMTSAREKKQALELLYNISSEDLMQAVGKVIAKSFVERKGMPFVPVIDGELLIRDGNALIKQGVFLPINYLIGSNADDLTTEGTVNKAPEVNMMHQSDLEFAKIVNEKTRNKAYVYYFDHRLPGDDSGAFHSGELWYIFGSLKYSWRPFTDNDYILSQKMIAHWSQFMKTGNPNVDESHQWLPCTRENPYYKVFSM